MEGRGGLAQLPGYHFTASDRLEVVGMGLGREKEVARYIILCCVLQNVLNK